MPSALTRFHSPANERGDDDAPGRAAAVGVGLLLALAASAAQANGIDEQEQEVQSQTGERHTSQQQDGLMDRGENDGKLKAVISMFITTVMGFLRNWLTQIINFRKEMNTTPLYDYNLVWK